MLNACIKLDGRSETRERMDDLQADLPLWRQTYQQLKSVNDLTLGYWPTMSAIAYFLKRHGRGRPMSILDIGCGDGETLRRIDAYARDKKFSLKLTGMDLNPEAITAANESTISKSINFICADALAGHHQLYDVMISSLTMHHLSNEGIVKLVQWMDLHVRIGWFICDLHRHAMAYYFIKHFVKLLRFNHLICHDAPLSVARGFRRLEWEDMLAQAGHDGDGTRIFWYPNFRYGVRYEKFI